MNRRSLLSSGAFVLLAGCALNGQPPSQAIQIAANDVEVIANGLQGALAQIAAENPPPPGMTPQLIAKIGTYVADLKSLAAAVAQASTTAQAQPLVQQVEADVNAIVAALAVLPLPQPLPAVLAAASILLPVIEASVGLIVTPPAPAPAQKLRMQMTPGEARAILRGEAQRSERLLQH